MATVPLPTDARMTDDDSPVRLRTPDREGETLDSLLDRRTLELDLAHHPAVLYRGFAGNPAHRLGELVRRCGDVPLDYDDPATPRTAVGGGVYTSTDYPASEWIPPHHEAVYAATWPRRLYFACVRPAAEGGATTVVDAGRVLADLSAGTVRRFREVGVTYVRTLHPRLGMSWQTVFGAQIAEDVPAICAERGMSAQWIDRDVLQTRQRRPAIIRGLDGAELFFNQVLAHHPRSLPTDVRDALAELLGEDLTPKHVRYGDGDPIGDDVIDEIAAAYAARAVPVDWQAGDVLVVDNMRMAHGREPFTGERVVRAVLAGAMSWAELVSVEPAVPSHSGGAQ